MTSESQLDGDDVLEEIAGILVSGISHDGREGRRRSNSDEFNVQSRSSF